MLRMLALHPGPDIGTATAAALINANPPRARCLLEDLQDLHFVAEAAPSRYRMDALIRAYATHIHTHGLGDGTRA